MSLGLRLLATFSHAPLAPEQLLACIDKWVRDKYSEVQPSTRLDDQDSPPSLLCGLHPAAEELEFSFVASDKLVASANTTTVGPGYHAFLCSLLKDLANELGVSWENSPEDDDFGDETGFFFSGNVRALKEEMTTWLAALANSFFDGTLESDSCGIALCLPMNPHFEANEAALTPLGPRDRAWLKQASQDGYSGKDFFAWWEPGFTAEHYLGRALTQMWTNVRWRHPVNSSEERIMQDVIACLRRAYELDPNLQYPWADWKQILELIDSKGPDLDLVNSHADGTPALGYRRKHVSVGLPGGWQIRVPGSFSDFETDEEGDSFAVDPPREIWFTAYRLESASAESFESGKKKISESKPDHVIDRDGYFAQAVIKEKRRDDGGRYCVLNSTNLAVGTRCVCTIVFASPDESDWAIETWRSLQPPSKDVI